MRVQGSSILPENNVSSILRENIGRKIGQPKQDAKLSNNSMIQEEDTTWMGSNYMEMSGISHVEMWEETASLGFVSRSVHASDEGSIYPSGLDDPLQCGLFP